jgi:hypothetical protein
MTQAKLGQLKREENLRQVWNSESGDFTPWLAQEENLAQLGEAIGLELELEAVEKGVGPFRADILCRDTANDSLVLIENQLEGTDHKHLGQIFTYGAGLNAVTIIWIATRFTDEHRAALDWLNEITNENINFFGLEIELWRIGDSPLAPKFNIVSKPNDWTKSIGSPGESDDLTETKQVQLAYWQAFRNLLLEKSTVIKPRRPRPQHWMNFAVGRSKFRLMTFANVRDRRIGVGLVISGPNAKPHFYLLQEQKETIEAEIGSALEWREMPNKRSSRVFLRWHDVDPANQGDWPEQHAWLLEKLERFYVAFEPRVKGLRASEYDLEEDTD